MKKILLQGKSYIQVSERVLEFNKLYPNGSIQTEPTFKDNTVYFKAVIYPDTTKSERFFNGHSFGELGKEKALEKWNNLSDAEFLVTATKQHFSDVEINKIEKMEEK